MLFYNKVIHTKNKRFSIKHLLIATICFISLTNISAQRAHREMIKGDQYFENQQFRDAEISYRRSRAAEPTDQANFNLGNSLYYQMRNQEAMRYFSEAVEFAKDPAVKAQAYHNLGNAHFKNGNLKESIAAYKNALKENPNGNNQLTKYNLNKAIQRQLKLQQPPPPSGGNQNQPPQNSDDPGQEDSNSRQNNQNQNQDQNPNNKNQEGSKQDETQPIKNQNNGEKDQTPEKELNKEEALRLLRILEDVEKDVIKGQRKKPGKTKKNEKDW